MQAKKKKRSRSLFERIKKYFITPEIYQNKGTAEHMDIPPGCHWFTCDSKARVYLVDQDNKIRKEYVVQAGRCRIVVPADCLVSVKCPDDVQWTFDHPAVAEKVDSTRMEVPLELQNSNEAHSNLRLMIDRFMRGSINIHKMPREEERPEDINNFGDEEVEHPFSRYEQAAMDEEKARSTPPSTSPSSTPSDQADQPPPQPVEVK